MTKTKISPTMLLAGGIGAIAGIGLVRALLPAPGQDWRVRRGHRARALITGASSGIGEAFARLLARRGYDLILTARREDLLETLAAEVRRTCGVNVNVIPADLATQAGIDHLVRVIEENSPLELLINNAGFGTQGSFAKSDLQRELDMIQVHINASVTLTHAALPGMIASRRGGIINLGSIAGFLALPGNATYSPSKIYLARFSEVLSLEMERYGISVQALCPGFTYSGFHDTPELSRFRREDYPRFMWMTSEAVAAQSLAALGNGQAVFVPGLVNKFIVWAGSEPLIWPIVRPILRIAARRYTWKSAPPGKISQ